MNSVSPPSRLPGYVVCPACHGPLAASGASELACSICGHAYGHYGGIANLLLGKPFEDVPDQERSISEERMDVSTTRGYTLPVAREFASSARLEAPLRILSVGCGVGAGVDLLNEEGFECIGIDCGSRIEDWRNRRFPDRFYIANAKQMPFANGSFDMIFSGCVLAHIGVVGDSWETEPDYWTQRSLVAAEMARLVRPGGQIVISGANRTCPVDLFHRDHGYLPRVHSSREGFLLSFRDYEKLFVEQNGCRGVSPMPIQGYWTFNGLTKTVIGRLAASLIGAHLSLVSRTPALRSSFLNPWLIVKIER